MQIFDVINLFRATYNTTENSSTDLSLSVRRQEAGGRKAVTEKHKPQRTYSSVPFHISAGFLPGLCLTCQCLQDVLVFIGGGNEAFVPM